MTRLWAGTSGFAYKEWRGAFYPEELPESGFLRYYGGVLPAVEINNTFYRLPKAAQLQAWCEQVPEEFRFALKASQKITHFKRLKNAGDETSYLFRAAGALGGRLGPVLFNLPPTLKKDLPLLHDFLALLAAETVEAPVAFDFRHASWLDEEVYAALTERGCLLCQTDSDEAPLGELVATAPAGYLRLRREYTDDELAGWLERVRARGWREVFLFFKHEEGGSGPLAARRFLELAGEGAG